jgi:hypothetical protein
VGSRARDSDEGGGAVLQSGAAAFSPLQALEGRVLRSEAGVVWRVNLPLFIRAGLVVRCLETADGTSCHFLFPGHR